MDILDTLSITNTGAVAITAFRFGKIGSDGLPAIAGAGDPVDGIFQYTTDGTATLMYDGILQVEAGAAITAGAEVGSDSVGRAVTAAGTNAVGRLTNNTSAANAGDMVEIQLYRRGQKDSTAPTLLAASGAIPVTPSSYNVITKAGVAVMTQAAPTADGVKITVTSDTANAHTITFTGNLLDSGSANVLTATFAAFKGAGLTYISYNGRWKVLSQIGITFS